MELPDNIESLKQIIRDQQAIIEKLQLKIAEQSVTIKQLQQMMFGRKSERRSKSMGIKPASNINQRNRNGRRPLPNHLSRERIDYTLNSEEQICSVCQNPLTEIGEVMSEQLECRQPQLYVKQQVRHKYACTHCQSRVVTAPMPEQPIAKGLAGSGLLTTVLIEKYEDALPLYRQEQRWQRLGYAINRSTLCDWVSQCAERLQPIVTKMQAAYLLTSPKIHSDDTVMPVLAPNKTHKGNMWTYVGGDHHQSPACVIYQYSPTRDQTVPFNFLKDYQGYVQADACPSYNPCYDSGHIIEVGCWAHTRRKFMVANIHANSKTAIDTLLDHIGKLYEIERKAKALPLVQRYYYRKRHAKPWLKIIYRWLKKYESTAPPKSLLSKAIKYTLNHWRALTNYLRKSYLAIDNNSAERAIKPLVIGRKNYLFAGSKRGAENAAVIYSLIQTCKALGVNTYDYLKSTLDKLPTTLMKNIADLFPHNFRPDPAPA